MNILKRIPLLQSILMSLYFIFAIMFLASLCRLAFILHTGVMSGAIKTFNFADMLTALFGGARYDARNIAAVGIIIFILSLLLFWMKNRVIIFTIIASFFAFILIFLTVSNDTYYMIYNDTFNSILMGLIYDDREAIFKTGISGDYNITFKIFLIIFLMVLFSYLFYKCAKYITKIKEIKFRYSLPILPIFFYIIALCITSSFDLFGGSLSYLVKPAKDSFLRKATPGAVQDFYLVYTKYKSTKDYDFTKFYPDGDIISALQNYYDAPSISAPVDIATLTLSEVTRTAPAINPQHIFIIIAESLSDYHFSDEFKAVNLDGGLSLLAQAKNGIKIPYFANSAGGTIGTVDVMLTGLFNTDIAVSDNIGRVPDFKSAPARIFKELGYNTNFFYFGSPTWRKLDRYTISQGYDNIFYNSHMSEKQLGIWGVYDDIGFNYISKKSSMMKDNKTFNMVLTTSYHPPYDIPLADYGINLDDFKNHIETLKKIDTAFAEMDPNILAHAFYSNKAIYDFVIKTSKEVPNSLFIITGDHFDRMYPTTRRTLKISNSVPLIIYGTDIERVKFKTLAGSHIDIVPTLIELIAPTGFKYSSFGNAMLSTDINTKIDNNTFAIGSYTVNNNRFFAETGGGGGYRILF